MKKIRRKHVYEGKLFDVVVENWGEREREIVEHPGSVTIVPIDADGRVVLTNQIREAARKELLELPAGMLDEGEAPLACAKRELAEETGLHGGQWRELRRIHPSPGILREPVTIFVPRAWRRASGTSRRPRRSRSFGSRGRSSRPASASLEDAKTLVGVLLYLCELAIE